MSTSTTSTLNRPTRRSRDLAHLAPLLPNAAFNRLMEHYVEKENPDKIIAWPRRPFPDWASDFRPKVFLDLGCGLGAVATSVLRRLNDWGCLTELREVVLVDNDAALHDQGAAGLKAFLEARLHDVLVEMGQRDVAVTAHVETLHIVGNGTTGADVVPLDRICPRADLVLASHFTYYFGDGSGRALVDAIARSRLSPEGRMWIDVRDLDCPVYRARRELLDRLGIDEPQPFDYAEHFEQEVLPSLPMVTTLDRGRVLVPARSGADATHAALLMMWRGELQGRSQREKEMIQAAASVARSATHLYSETQFILELKNGAHRVPKA